jgi:hypothetical protein
LLPTLESKTGIPDGLSLISMAIIVRLAIAHGLRNEVVGASI